MQVQLHKNARTTPAIRRELQASTERTDVLAKRYNLSPLTVAKWRRRESTEDASHRPHRLPTNLSSGQELLVVELRKLLLLPLADLLVVTQAFINDQVSRSGLDRCLRRHGVSRLADIIPREETEKTPVKGFKDYEPGFVHVDVKYLPQMPDEDARQYLFAAIDRATRWVYVEILPTKCLANAAGFLKRLLEAAPFKIAKVLTDNGKEFTDRFCATGGQREPTGNHPFGQVCTEHAIDHRLIKPRHPQTPLDQACRPVARQPKAPGAGTDVLRGAVPGDAGACGRAGDPDRLVGSRGRPVARGCYAPRWPWAGAV